MRKSRFNEEQKIGTLKKSEAGEKSSTHDQICRAVALLKIERQQSLRSLQETEDGHEKVNCNAFVGQKIDVADGTNREAAP